MNRYFLQPVHAFQVRETLQRNLGCSSNELNQFCEIFIRVFAQNFPIPLDNIVVEGVACILGVLSEIVQVYGGHSGHEKFKFFGLEEADAFFGENFVEALEELLNLSVD